MNDITPYQPEEGHIMSEYESNQNIVSMGEPSTVLTRQSLLELQIGQDSSRSACRGAARRQEVARRYRLLPGLPLRDAAWGYPTLEQVRGLHARLVSRVHADIEAGATVHRPLPGLLRRLPWAVLVLDGLILYSFCADIFNARAAEFTRASVAALALAVMGSGMTFAWLSLTGTRLRDYRNRMGEICWRATSWSTRFLVAASGLIALTLGVLMYARVVEQAAQAGNAYVAAAQVPVLGWVFAILSLCANLTVVAVHALDGSALSAEMRHGGKAIRRAEKRLDRARRKAWRTALRAQECTDPLNDAPADRRLEEPAA